MSHRRSDNHLDERIRLRFWLERKGFDPAHTAVDPSSEMDAVLGWAVGFRGEGWAA